MTYRFEESECLLLVGSLGTLRSLFHGRLAQFADALGSAGSQLLEFLRFGWDNFAFPRASEPWYLTTWAVRAFSS